MANEKHDFEAELVSMATVLRQQIEANAEGIDASKAVITARRKRVLKGDFEYFSWHYFPHHVWGKLSIFHTHFVKRFPLLLNTKQGCKEWWVAPRGESKSTLLTKIGPVFVAVLGLLQKASVRKEIDWTKATPKFLDYIVLLGAESKLPTKLLNVVKTELESNARLAMDFPEIVGRGKTWRMSDILTTNNVLIEAFGAEQAVRGTFHGASRPKVLLGDDLITDKEAKSLKERNNRWDWLEKAIDYLGPPDGSVKYLGMGTILNQDDPISRAKKSLDHVVHHFKAIEQMPFNMHLWNKCEELIRNDDKIFKREQTAKDLLVNQEDLPSHVFYLKNKILMDEGAVISWPSVRDLYHLMVQRIVKPVAFKTEMQGEARSDEDRVFTDLHFWVSRLSHWVYFGACDPSMGRGESADPSAILVGGFDPQVKKLHLVHAEIKRRVDSKLYADLIKAQKEFSCARWGFENNNSYEYMRTSFMQRALAEQVVLSMIGVTATVPQDIRIDSLEPHIVGIDPDILFHHSQVGILDELDTWPESQQHHHYDGLTALHILWMISVSRSGGIPQIHTPTQRSSVRWQGY